MNLLQETLKAISDAGLTINDIDFIGSNDGQYVIDYWEFCKIVEVEYDNNSGGQIVATDLVIVFKNNSWLKRFQHGCNEWWGLCKLPVKKDNGKKFTVMLSNYSDLDIDYQFDCSIDMLNSERPEINGSF